ncbi:hypothetical protein AAEU32_12550 [Pseudoalteromonas sp. SSDWG2]|uniref:hypothetical protein n=1 Tax=Pseudoalteromonas sp. SSDWG2 TaxID=3139391 RepID=UPI003BAD12E5
MTTHYRIFVIPLCLFAAMTAQAKDIGLGVKAGSLGLGLELDYSINDNWNIRLQTNSYDYDDDFEEDGIEYTGELNLSTTGVLVDWRPWGSSFRLSGGIYNNKNRVRGRSLDISSGSYNIGDADYTPDSNDPLTLDARVDLGDSTAGYLGLGWGNSPSNDSRLSFSFELGVIFSGNPEVDLQASGSAFVSANGMTERFSLTDTSDPLVQQFYDELEQERLNLEDDVSDFDMYPVISLGVAYQF